MRRVDTGNTTGGNGIVPLFQRVVTLFFGFRFLAANNQNRTPTANCTEKQSFMIQQIQALNCLHIEISSQNKAITLILVIFQIYIYISFETRSLIKNIGARALCVADFVITKNARSQKFTKKKKRNKVSLTSVKHKC